MAAVDEEVGHVLRAVEADEDPFRGPFGRDAQVVLVEPRGFAQRAFGRRVVVPAVGQRHEPGVVAVGFRGVEEAPALVERIDFAGPQRQGPKQQQSEQDISFHDDSGFPQR